MANGLKTNQNQSISDDIKVHIISGLIPLHNYYNLLQVSTRRDSTC